MEETTDANKILIGKSYGKRPHGRGDLGVDERIILKLNLKR
jgi:hypothetical protein